jgi:hypothetical protein
MEALLKNDVERKSCARKKRGGTCYGKGAKGARCSLEQAKTQLTETEIEEKESVRGVPSSAKKHDSVPDG